MSVYDAIINRKQKVAVIGLGYVGLPLAVSFSRVADVIGYDVDENKIQAYRQDRDPTGELGDALIRACDVEFTSDEQRLNEACLFIITVPTPVLRGNVPDLRYLKRASQTVGRHMRQGTVIVFESTVYPGVTEEICIPILEAESGMVCGVDFKVGYSPERINPGDSEHRLENIAKIVSGIDEDTTDLIAKIYELVIKAGVYKAESIRVAEAAKLVENAQRDINIAFMNEIAILFNNMGINTKSVLQAARTKWNFLPYTPGLVGGHCISIDPYYLTFKAEDTGYRSRLISAARNINDGMGRYVGRQIVKILVREKQNLEQTKVGILGLSYKENCPDIRNTKVIDLVSELEEYGIDTVVADPLVDKQRVYEECGLRVKELDQLRNVNVLVLAVPHNDFLQMSIDDYDRMCEDDDRLNSKEKRKILVDIKGVLDRDEYESHGYVYWNM